VTLVLLPLGIQNYALPFWLMAAAMVLAAIIVVAVSGPVYLSRHHRLQHPPRENSRVHLPHTLAPPTVRHDRTEGGRHSRPDVAVGSSGRRAA
jgi:hypothetical protein